MECPIIMLFVILGVVVKVAYKKILDHLNNKDFKKEGELDEL